ncbi:MAG TPA: prolyl oligopeptidase family serine peptidase [Bryobacteraceae bacterium]|nr:prolyl oligopeptidase family serine peptidase [Bryobacteraceae bacterium]
MKALAAIVLAGALCTAAADDLPPIPSTPKRPVTDEYTGGVKIVDDYRWLEPPSSSEVREWSNSQNARTRAYLDRLPMRRSIGESLTRLLSTDSTRFSALSFTGSTLFAIETKPPKPQAFLVTLDSVDDPGAARAIVDPNTLDASGATSIDFYVPSPDAKLVAVSLSKGGSEEGSVSIFEVATGKRLSDLIPRVNGATAGGSLVWNSSSTGFWYTHYPRAGERAPADLNFYQQIYFHRIGVAQDEYALGKEFPRIAEVALDSSDDGKYILARVANGDGGDFLHYLLGADGKWHQITRLSDQTSTAAFGPGNSLFLLSHKDAPMGKIVELTPPSFSLANAKTVVTPGRSSIDGFVPAGPHLFVRYMAGGPSKLLDKEAAKSERTVDIPPVSSVGEMVRVKGDQLLFESQSFTEPSAWYRYDPATGQAKKTALSESSPAGFSDVEVTRQVAVSKDGTHVPMSIMRRKGMKLDGSNPALLTGYGGYSISMSPNFQARRRVWMDHGGVWVVANLRGGAEFGETWHEQGRLAKKQNVFDDFIACAEYLIKSKYTSPEKLAIEGGSNGGLLMGAALTQRPELFRAVVSHVGIYDMLRVETFPNGAFNVTEFGTVKEQNLFQALFGYSPYHHVKDGVDYPAVLLLTGDNDGRVDPMNSRKMTARLQTATHSDRPILLRTSSGTGHGFGTALNERIEQDADVFAFLFEQLGMK